MRALNSSNSPEQMQPITTEQMKGFRDSVGQINRGFGNSEQQDAHELLVVLLEAFHDLAAAIGEPSLDPSSLFEIEISIGFGCKQCGDRDVTTEHCHEMFLPVDEPTNIQKLIVSAVQSEKERTCSLCGNGTAMKSEKIARYPEVLLVVLKRHEQHRNTYKKVNSEVIPSFTLCLRALEELGEDLQSERNYQLSSLVGHVGTVPTCGH